MAGSSPNWTTGHRKDHQCSLCKRRFHSHEGLQEHTRRHRGRYHVPSKGETLPVEQVIVGGIGGE